jgi:regulator of sigma E protease
MILNILCVAMGLGLVIFIHELGHFAVAKWCDVRVERFSIGFGPIIWKWTWGETDYALSAIPFGGYVKMLGQDDADPSQMTDTSIAKNPRAYPAKTVPQRIAIISAGVLMNLMSAILFFIIAFLSGVEHEPAVIGSVVPGMPGWEAGLRPGDRLTRVGSRDYPDLSFMDLRQAVALSDGPVEVEGERDGKKFRVTVHPSTKDHKDKDRLFPIIGVEHSERSLVLYKSPVIAGLSASRASPAFEGGDEFRRIDDTEVRSYADFQKALSTKRDKTLVFQVHRKGQAADAPLEKINITVGPNNFRTLGLRMDIGKITAIQLGSPAWANRTERGTDDQEKMLKVGDKLTHVIVDGQEHPVGSDLDPLRLPDFFAEHAGEELVVRVKRERVGKDPEIVDVPLVPEDRAGWIEKPAELDCPLSVPAIGVAFHVLHNVVKVDPNGPAAGKLAENDTVQKLEFVTADGKTPDLEKPFDFGEKDRNWPALFWRMQSIDPDWNARLTVIPYGSKDPKVVDLKPTLDTNWYLPMRGLVMEPLKLIKRADGVGDAIRLGFRQTRNSVVEVYFTIKGLASGRISKKALGGPITIAQVAFIFSERGVPDLILFLAILSVNLAVLNFLPIPVLDGGHFVFLCWEGIRGKPPSERVVIAANYVGLAMVLSLMVWVMWLDISRLAGWQ